MEDLEFKKFEKQSKVAFIISLIVIISVAIGCFFMGYAFGKNRTKSNNIISSAYAIDNIRVATATANTTSTFNSDYFNSSIYVDYANLKYYAPLHGALRNFKVIDAGSSYNLSVDIWSYYEVYDGAYGSSGPKYEYLVDNTQSSATLTSQYSFTGLSLAENYIFFNNRVFHAYSTNNGSQDGRSVGVSLWYSVGNVSGFGDPVGVTFGNIKSSDYNNLGFYAPNLVDFGFTYNGNVFIVSFFDAYDNHITLGIFIDYIYNDYSGLDTLYFDSDTTGNYSNGYSVGYQEGLQNGNVDGYQRGYTNGQSVGYNSGYSAGVQDANDYSFLGLISAVIDAPIKIFSGLFNFSIFGVNMTNFLFSLASITLVIVIVRFVLGRKE